MMISLAVLESKRVTERHTAVEPLLIYIAAPYSEPDPVVNTHGVLRIADALLENGFTPVIPHLNLLWHLFSPKPYETWLAYDRGLLERCDAVLRVPGFSVGAARETRFAKSMNIPVIHSQSGSPEECVKAVEEWLVSP